MSYTLRKIIQLIMRYRDVTAIAVIGILICVYFYRSILSGLLPVPSDALVGLYHPYRDYYSGGNPRGIPFKNFLITDPVRQQIPWRKQGLEYLRSGRFPTRDAWSFSGTTLIGNIQSGVFYPINILFFILPFPLAWTVLIMSQPLLSAVFFYLFIRNLRIRLLPSLFGSMLFAFGGYATAWMAWGTIVSAFLWVPLSLFAIDKLYEQKHMIRYLLLLVFSVICSFFAGHIQFFLYGIGLLIWYWLKRYRKILSGKTLVLLCSAGLLSIAITSIQWIPMLRQILESSRGTAGAVWNTEGFFIPISHLVQYIVPDYFGNPSTMNYWGIWNYGEMVGYIGIAGIICAMFGINRDTRLWIVAVIIPLLFAVDSPVSRLPYRMQIPILSVFQPTRLLAIVGFSLSVLSSYGLHRLAYYGSVRLKRIIAFILCAVALVWISVIYPQVFHITSEHAEIIRRNSLLPTVLVIIVTFIILSVRYNTLKLIKRMVPLLLLIIGIMDVFRFSWKFMPFTKAEYFFPETKIISYLKKQPQPFRVMTTDERILPANVSAYYGIESVSGYDPVHSLRYDEFAAAMERGKPDTTPPFGFERIMTLRNHTSPLFSFLNVRYVLSFDELPKQEFAELFREGQTILYEVNNFIPRFYLADNITVAQNDKKMIESMYQPNAVGAFSAIISSDYPVGRDPLTRLETVKVLSYTPEQSVLSVTAEYQRLLVIGLTYDTSLHVSIDGKRAQVLRTNYIMSGVVVPQGTHTVEILYSAI